MIEMLHAPLITSSIVAVAELGIADMVADGPLPVAELAELVAADPDALYRVLRALASVGVFQETRPGVFGATPLTDVLRSGVDGSLRNWARLWGLRERHDAIGGLLASIRTGAPAFEIRRGETWWSHLTAHPDQAAVFGAAMGDIARELHAAAVRGYDLSGVRCLVDVGGGEGHLAAVLLRRYPAMSAVVFDRPAVTSAAEATLAEAGLSDRAVAVGGDFFASVPAGGDVYLLSMILHDWNDEQAHAILTAVRRVLPPHGRVLVIDAVVPDDDSPHDGKLRDLIMLALHPGRERTEAEFTTLLADAGLRRVETRAISASTGLLVAVPASR